MNFIKISHYVNHLSKKNKQIVSTGASVKTLVNEKLMDCTSGFVNSSVYNHIIVTFGKYFTHFWQDFDFARQRPVAITELESVWSSKAQKRFCHSQ